VQELGELILLALYEEGGGQIQRPMDPLAIVQRREPGIPARHIASEVTALAARGLLTVRPDAGAALTVEGLRKLGELRAAGPDALATKAKSALASIDPAPPEDDEELDLDRIMELVRYREGSADGAELASDALTVQARMPSVEIDLEDDDSPWDENTEMDERAETARTRPDPGVMRLGRLRHELNLLNKELTSATTLPIEIWTRALELARQLDRTVGALEHVLSKKRR